MYSTKCASLQARRILLCPCDVDRNRQVVLTEIVRVGYVKVVQEQIRFRSPLPPDDLRAALAAVVEPTAWPPPLIFKLSGGGIVSRVMESPETDHPFFGRVDDEKIRIARASRRGQVTPFQPIVLIAVSATADGSRLEVKLRPHREAVSLSGLFMIAGLTMIGAAIPALLSGDSLGVIAIFIGLIFMIFPKWRERLSFRTDRDDAVQALCAALPLQVET